MYGSAGTPLTYAIQQILNTRNADTPDFSDEPVAAFFDKGLMDGLVYAATGSRTDISDAAGTGGFWVDTMLEMFNAGKYGETTPIEALTGATGGIWGDAFLDLLRVAKVSSAERGFGGPMSNQAVNQVFRNISSYNNMTKAYMAYRYGVLTSTKGSFLYEVDDKERAATLALLGVPMDDENKLSAMINWNEHRKSVKEDFVKMLVNYRTALENDWGNADQLIQQINVTVQMAPPELRQELIEEMNKYPTDALFNSVQKNIEQKMAEKKLARSIDKDVKERNK